MVKTDNGVEVDHVQYRYDVDGLRIGKNDDGQITNYLVDKNRDYGQVLKELDETHTPIVSYLYGDDLIKQTRAANDNYYLYDGQGSTRALADGAGIITDTYDYSAYGTLIDSTGFVENSYLYVGEQFDENVDQYYLRARYYDSSLGRFITEDSFLGILGEPITLHKYIYGNLDPINNLDPSGNISLVQATATIGIGFSLALTATQLPMIHADISANGSSSDRGWLIIMASSSDGSRTTLCNLIKGKSDVIPDHGDAANDCYDCDREFARLVNQRISLARMKPSSRRSWLILKHNKEVDMFLAICPDYDDDPLKLPED